MNTYTARGRFPEYAASRPLGRFAILADQAAEDLPTLDPGGDIDGMARLMLRRFLLQALVRTVAIVMLGVLGQDAAEVPLAEDQHVVRALTPKRPHEPLRVGVGPHRQRHPIHMTGTDVCG